MKKLLPTLIFSIVLSLLIPALPTPSFGSTGSMSPDRATETDSADVSVEIDIPTIAAGMIPDPMAGERGIHPLFVESEIRPLAAESAYHEAYNELYYAMLNVRADCSLSRYQLTKDVVSSLFADVMNHSPELFYVGGRLGISYNRTTGIVSSVSFAYTMTGQEIEEAARFYRLEIDRILSGMPDGMRAFDKALWLHDYLCVRYAYDADSGNFDAYSFFRNGGGVCQGYTLAYMALMNACGIRTDYASSTDMNHIWNLIELDGAWYHVDVTWDDPIHRNGSDIPGRAGHDNFLCSDQAIAAVGHYNWTAYPCDSELYDSPYLDTIQTAFAYLDGSWYFADRQDGGVRLMTFPTAENPVPEVTLLFEVPGIWYRWGENVYYLYNYTNLCSVDGKLCYSMPSAVGSYDPSTGEFEPVMTYTGEEGYIYALYAEGSTLYYGVSKAPSGSEVLKYSFDMPAAPETDPVPPETDEPPETVAPPETAEPTEPTEPPETTDPPETEVPPETVDPPEEIVEYLNLSCGEDAAAALVSNTSGAEGQTVRVLMIGNISLLSAYAELRFTVHFELDGQEVFLYQERGEALIFYQSVTDGSDRFTAAEGYLLFGVRVGRIPPDAWSAAEISLTDGETGQVLCSLRIENSRERMPEE